MYEKMVASAPLNINFFIQPTFFLFDKAFKPIKTLFIQLEYFLS